MRVQYHTALSTVVSVALFGLFKSWPLTIASFLTGVLIDIDHVIDYLFLHGPRFNIQQFFRSSYQRQYVHAVLIFHGWEWLGLLAILVAVSDANPWFTGLLVGYTHHLTLDQIGNRPDPWGYSIVWRMRHGFLFNLVFPIKNWPYMRSHGDRSWTR
jgi:CDP-diglyceride synthetase